MIDIDIREASEEDLETILGLLEKYDLYTDDFEEFKSNFILAMDKGKIVGCIAHKVLGKEAFEIRSVVVAEGYRRNGIATKLIKSKIEYLEEKGVREFYAVILKKRKPSHSLFEKLGFRKLSREEVYRYIPTCNECRGDFYKMHRHCRIHSEDRKCPVDIYRKLI